MTDTVVSPNKGFTLLNQASFANPAKVLVDVILTFDSNNDEGESQEDYDVDVVIDLSKVDVAAIEARTETDILSEIEVDVVAQILDKAQRDLSDLVKISLCYMTDRNPHAGDPALEGIVDYLCRFNAKYYFQPDQRDPHEQAVVDALGIASRTAPVKSVA